jgi:CMP-N,N'-diacetyllegionaminic acid synthase
MIVIVASSPDEAIDRGARLGLIPARGGSRGVPGKNTKLLAGVPLIAHSIRSARASGAFESVYVSTEDDEIAQIAQTYGAEVIPRPRELAQASTPMSPVVEHALAWNERERGSLPRRIFLLQPTSPLRSGEDIRTAARMLDTEDCDAVMGVFEADDPPQWGLRANAGGMLRPIASWDQYMARRQDLPATYLDGALYAIHTDAFLAHKRFLTKRTRFFVMPRDRAIDIDTEIDFLFAEFLLTRRGEADASRQVEEHLV